MLVVEKVGCVAWIEVHSLESFIRRQRCASPFPQAAEIALSTESVAVASNGRRMPVTESDIVVAELYKEIIGVGVGMSCTPVDDTVRQMA